jgi:EthD domain
LRALALLSCRSDAVVSCHGVDLPEAVTEENAVDGAHPTKRQARRWRNRPASLRAREVHRGGAIRRTFRQRIARDQAVGEDQALFKLICHFKGKPGLTLEQFRDYYENHHVKLVREVLPHAIDYRRNYRIDGAKFDPYDDQYSDDEPD